MSLRSDVETLKQKVKNLEREIDKPTICWWGKEYPTLSGMVTAMYDHLGLKAKVKHATDATVVVEKKGKK